MPRKALCHKRGALWTYAGTTEKQDGDNSQGLSIEISYRNLLQALHHPT